MATRSVRKIGRRAGLRQIFRADRFGSANFRFGRAGGRGRRFGDCRSNRRARPCRLGPAERWVHAGSGYNRGGVLGLLFSRSLRTAGDEDGTTRGTVRRAFDRLKSATAIPLPLAGRAAENSPPVSSSKKPTRITTTPITSGTRTAAPGKNRTAPLPGEPVVVEPRACGRPGRALLQDRNSHPPSLVRASQTPPGKE